MADKDFGKFIAGAILTGAGIASLATGFGGALVGWGVLDIGLQMMLVGIKGTPETNARGFQVNNAGTGESMFLVYGRSKVGGKLHETYVDPDSDNRELLVRGVSFCVASENGQGIDNISQVAFDDFVAIDQGDASGYRSLLHHSSASTDGVQDFFSDKLTYNMWDGSDDNPVDPDLNNIDSIRWPTNAKPQRIACGNFFLRWDDEVYSGIPRITAIVRGNQVWDPRLGARDDNTNWDWSENPALCTLDYMLSDFYGCQLDEADIDIDSFIDAANYCDGSTTPRFTCNGVLDTGNSLISNLNALLSSCRGELVYRNGQYALIIKRASVTATMELDETNIVGDWQWNRSGSKEAPNSIVAKYVDAGGGSMSLQGNDYVTDETEWPPPDDNDFLVSDNGVPQKMTMDLPLTDDFNMAQGIAMVVLKEAREDTTVTVTCTEDVLQLQVGDLVSLSHPTPGWESKEFWVHGMTISEDNLVRLVLREYSDLAYSLDPFSDKPTVPGTSLPDPFNVPSPTNLGLTSGDPTAIPFGDGSRQPRILATWVIPNPTAFYSHTQVRFRPITDDGNNPISDPKWQRLPDVGTKDTTDSDFSNGISYQLFIDNVKNGFEYEVEVRAVNTLGFTSDWVTANQLVSVTGEQSPVIQLEIEEDTSNGTGTVDATVTDPGGGAVTVEFFEKTGPGVFPGTADQTHNSVASGSTLTYNVTLDNERNTYVRVVATIDSNGHTNSATAVFDSDIVAELLNLGASVDDDSHEVVVSADGDSDTDNIYITVGVDTAPADPTDTANDASIAGNSGTIATGVTVGENERAFVKARGSNSTSGLSYLILTTITSVGAHGAPIILTDTYEDESTGSVDATVVDPDGGSLQVDFYERQGNNDSYGTAVTTITGASSGSQHTESIGLVEKKNSWIKVEATVEATGKSSSTELVFDADKIAQIINLVAFHEDDGTIGAEAIGDTDTATIYLTHTVDGTAPAAPDSTNATATIGGRQGTAIFSDELEVGSTLWVKARGENVNGTLAPTDTIVSARTGKPGINSAPGVTPEATLERAGSDPNNQQYGVTAFGGSDVESPALEYKWRAQGSPTASDQVYDHNGDGDDDWQPISEGVQDTFTVTKPDSPTPEFVEAIVRDTSIGEEGSHPFTRATATMTTTATDSTGIQVTVIPTTTDPGEDTTNEPDGTIWAVYS